MTHINQLISRHSVVLLAVLVVAFGVSFTLAHADSGHRNGIGVFIGADGKASVHGATVTATSTTGLTATTNLGGNLMTWNVLASSTTRFGKWGQGLSALTHVAVGDIVSFLGKLSGSGSTLTVDAQVVKDHTKQGTTTPLKIGKGPKHALKIGAQFEHFLDVHEGIKTRIQERLHIGSEKDD